MNDEEVDEEAQMKYEPWFLFTMVGIGALHIVLCALWMVKSNKKMD